MDKAYGTAYTVMNSKAIGADMVYAWPDAVIGTMDPEMAVKIMYEDELAAADDKLAFIKEKKAEYVAALQEQLRQHPEDISMISSSLMLQERE